MMCSSMAGRVAGSIRPFECAAHVPKGCRNKLLPGGPVAVWPCGVWAGGRVAGWPWPGGRVAGWPGGRVAGWPAGRLGGWPWPWPGGRVAGWPGGRVAGWPGDRVAGWPWPGRGRDGRQLKKAIVICFRA